MKRYAVLLIIIGLLILPSAALAQGGGSSSLAPGELKELTEDVHAHAFIQYGGSSWPVPAVPLDSSDWELKEPGEDFRPIALAQGQDDTLVIPAGQHVAGNVATVERNIRVEGVVDGDVTSWSGSITIFGNVGGDVVSYGGAVTIAATGRVGGHVLASGGVLHLAEGAVVAGQAIRAEGGGGALASLLDLLTPAPNLAGGGPIGHLLFGAAMGVLLLAFCWLYIAFWPRRTAIASATLQRLPARALALGLLTTMMLGFLVLPVSGLLMASVIGLPLLIVLFVVVHALYIYGMATFVRSVASWRAPMHQPEVDIRTMAIALGLVLLIAVCAALMPLWGLALFYLVASPGLGAAILSRGGLAVPVSARS